MSTQKNRINEHPKHMFKLMGNNIFTGLRSRVPLYVTMLLFQLLEAPENMSEQHVYFHTRQNADKSKVFIINSALFLFFNDLLV